MQPQDPQQPTPVPVVTPQPINPAPTAVPATSSLPPSKPAMSLQQIIKRKKIQVILITIGAFLLLILSVGIGLYLTTGKERSLADKFVNDVSNSRISEAYSQFSNELKAVQSQSTFEGQVEGVDLNNTCKLEVNGLETKSTEIYGTVKTVSGRVSCNSGTDEHIASFSYNKEGKLLEYSIGA
ncbi:MAG: hypothetical protein WCQ49_01740 [Candidatus Saccharibacteria bacterium]